MAVSKRDTEYEKRLTLKLHCTTSDREILPKFVMRYQYDRYMQSARWSESNILHDMYSGMA